MDSKPLPKINIVGIGPGDPTLLTWQAREIISTSAVVIGSTRMIEGVASTRIKGIDVGNNLEKIAEQIRAHRGVENISVLVSGDCGFYSLAKNLYAELEEEYEVEFYNGVSSLQYFCAKLKQSWHDVKVISLHGRDQNLLQGVRDNRRVFVLTGGKVRVQDICGLLSENGWGHLPVHVGERLSYPEERILSAQAFQLVKEEFDSLAVMLIENPGEPRGEGWRYAGIPDEQFVRGELPMTKEEVRSISISKLRLAGHHTVFDIGAGTGSVSVECALRLPEGKVYAVEKEEAGIRLIEKNAARFHVHNIVPVLAEAPENLAELPVPDRAFIGGSQGKLSPIVHKLIELNSAIRIVINAITLETALEAVTLLEELGMQDVELIQVGIARTKKVGRSHMLMGQNPIYIISGG